MFLKNNKGQAFSIKELQEKLNDTTIKSGTINTLFAENIIESVYCETINEKGQKLLIRKIIWADGKDKQSR